MQLREIPVALILQNGVSWRVLSVKNPQDNFPFLPNLPPGKEYVIDPMGNMATTVDFKIDIITLDAESPQGVMPLWGVFYEMERGDGFKEWLEESYIMSFNKSHIFTEGLKHLCNLTAVWIENLEGVGLDLVSMSLGEIQDPYTNYGKTTPPSSLN